MNIEKFKQLVESSYSKSQVYRQLGWPSNGTSSRKFKKLVEENNIDYSHFNQSECNRKYPLVVKECPVCGTEFEASLGSPREKQTCSYSCSNTQFRSGENNPNWKETSERSTKLQYRIICEKNNEHKCLICGWDISVDAHHIDRDHSNNDISNLCFLCPNHHRMAHMSEHQDDIDSQINRFNNC